MPNYDFICLHCEYRYEKILLVHNITVEVCPKCGGISERQFPAPTVKVDHALNYAFDPVLGKDLSKEEIKDIRARPWPESSDYARKHNIVGK